LDSNILYNNQKSKLYNLIKMDNVYKVKN
jgi:hypothetical protein